MGQEEFGTHAWMLTHAVAIETSMNKAGTHARPGTSIMTDIYLMILCKAFLLPVAGNTKPEPVEQD